MKNRLFSFWFLPFVVFIFFTLTACPEFHDLESERGGSSDGSSSALWNSLSSGSGKWVHDSQFSTQIEFTPGEGPFYTYQIRHIEGGSTKSTGGQAWIEPRSNVLELGSGATLTVTFHSESKATFEFNPSSPLSVLSGPYTRQ